ITSSAVSSRPNPISTSVESESCALARWLRIAPFGLPVVPEVYISVHVSSGPTGVAGSPSRCAAERDVVRRRDVELVAHLVGSGEKLVLHDERLRLAVLRDVTDLRPDQ